ncbi:O-antigen ligase family protein [Thalassotalea sp. G20_0]|uniref:O-antigen ligase family protein n=1 Tax=Thalassotalea sp. G20_0 TaxID=2821093 RepID=UPI001ADC8854|nr:O-antigen ligase family protein [Thalassotalea sp. G20_0]MBO9496924.1 O-antigen ligase family protein [Thalassotalea sp. G20_0]
MKYINLCFLIILVSFFLPSIDPIFINLSIISALKYPFVFIGFIVNVVYIINNGVQIRIDEIYKSIISIVFIFLLSAIFSYDVVITTTRTISAMLVLFYLLTYVSIVSDPIIQFEKLGVLISMFTILTCYYVLVKYDQSLNIAGNFRGIYYNSNFLGFIISVVCIPSLYLLFYRIKSSNQAYKHKGVIVSLLIALFYLLIISKSRSAILTSIIFLLSFYWFYTESKKKYIANIIALSMVFLIILLTSPEYRNTTLDYFYKYESITGDRDITSTRYEIWKTRIDSVSLKPILGWGYGINPAKVSNQIQDLGHGDTEKGNSVLATIEESGLFLGCFILFLYFRVIYINIKALRRTNSINYVEHAILVSVLIAGFFHTNFESWLFYFGNTVAIFYWLLLVSSRKYFTKLPQSY